MITPLSRWRSSARIEVYTVHEPPEAPADRIERAERLLFVRDGFSWAAAIFGPFWLAARSLWMALGAYAVVAAVLVLVFEALGANEAWISIAVVALNAILGFEASSLERASLDAAGWSELGTVSGLSLPECERRFLEGWLPTQPAIAMRGTASQATAPGVGATTGTSSTPEPKSSARGWRRLFGSKG